MDKKTEKILGEMARDQDSLRGSLADVEKKLQAETNERKALQQRVDQQDAVLADLGSSTRSSSDTSTEDKTVLTDEKEAEMEDTGKLADEIIGLKDQVAELSSDEHNDKIVTAFLADMDLENYLELGKKKGFLEISQEAGEAITEASLGDNSSVKFSRTEPEDLTGWQHSESLGLWVKVEENT